MRIEGFLLKELKELPLYSKWCEWMLWFLGSNETSHVQPPSGALNSYCRTKCVSNMVLCQHFSGDFISNFSRKPFFHVRIIEMWQEELDHLVMFWSTKLKCNPSMPFILKIAESCDRKWLITWQRIQWWHWWVSVGKGMKNK